jgi:glycolate oxidase iron-sulfur subunit
MPPNSSPSGSPLQQLDYSILQQCMHCGLCLPSCPTYAETGRERNSPRGRISLMRAVADGELETTRGFAEEMDYCVGCLACTSACPAGVDYADLLEHARAQVEQSGVVASPRRTFWRRFTLETLFMRPRLLRFAGRTLWLAQITGLIGAMRLLGLTRLLPVDVRQLEPSTPKIRACFSDSLIRETETPPNRRYRVALLTGCVQDLVASDVNRATADVLLANGCEVFTPRAQSCCGSLHAHNGELGLARALARRQLDAIDPATVDAIISNAAGCGSHLKRFGHLLKDDPAYAAKAAEWTRKLRDISEWLVEIDFRKPRARPARARRPFRTGDVAVTYHEACHLCHGQGISRQPREILRAIPGLELRECREATWCCGSAGIYSITQPKTARWLRDRKLSHLKATGAPLIATANAGCSLHLQAGIREAGDDLSVLHPVILLAEAYAAEKAPREPEKRV